MVCCLPVSATTGMLKQCGSLILWIKRNTFKYKTDLPTMTLKNLSGMSGNQTTALLTHRPPLATVQTSGSYGATGSCGCLGRSTFQKCCGLILGHSRGYSCQRCRKWPCHKILESKNNWSTNQKKAVRHTLTHWSHVLFWPILPLITAFFHVSTYLT